MARRRVGRVYLGQAQAPVAALPEAAFFFGVETDAAGHMGDVYAGVVQGGGGQLTHAFVCPRGEGVFLAGAAVENPDHAQALGKGAIVDGVGQPGEARDFSFGGFTGFGQGGDETTLNTGVVT